MLVTMSNFRDSRSQLITEMSIQQFELLDWLERNGALAQDFRYECIQPIVLD